MPFSQCRVGNLGENTLAQCQSDPLVGPSRTVRAIRVLTEGKTSKIDRVLWSGDDCGMKSLSDEMVPIRKDTPADSPRPYGLLSTSVAQGKAISPREKQYCRVCECHYAHSGIKPGWLVGSRAQPVSSKTDGQHSGQHVPSGQRNQAHQTRRMFLTGILWAGLAYGLTLSWGLRGHWGHLRHDRGRRAAPPCRQ